MKYSKTAFIKHLHTEIKAKSTEPDSVINEELLAFKKTPEFEHYYQKWVAREQKKSPIDKAIQRLGDIIKPLDS